MNRKIRRSRTLLWIGILAVALGCARTVAPDPVPAAAPAVLQPVPAEANLKLAPGAAAPLPESGAASAVGAVEITDPYAGGGVFRKAQFHMHTANSFDGDKNFPPAVTAQVFKDAGYAFIVFTDHDVITQYSALNDDTFYAGSGYESSGAGHIGALLLDSHVNQLLPAAARIAAIEKAGGIAFMNHPDWEIGFSAEQLLALHGYQALEIFNAISTKTPQQQADNLEKWRQVLNARGPGEPVWAVAVSDTHRGSTGGGWEMVKTSAVNEQALRGAIRRGSMYASNGPEFATLHAVNGWIVAAAAGAGPHHVKFIDAAGQAVYESDALSAQYHPSGDEGWLRVELSDGAGHTAWSQPFWVRRAPAATGFSARP